MSGLVEYNLPETPSKPAGCVLCSPSMLAKLLGKDPSCEISPAEVEKILGRFIAGYTLKVSRKKRSGKKLKAHQLPELERLEGFDEVWVVCVRRPGNGWRISGRFPEKHVLVLLDVTHKDDIGYDYTPVVTRVTGQWQALFGALKPLSGADFSDYLYGSPVDVDQFIK